MGEVEGYLLFLMMPHYRGNIPDPLERNGAVGNYNMAPLRISDSKVIVSHFELNPSGLLLWSNFLQLPHPGKILKAAEEQLRQMVENLRG